MKREYDILVEQYAQAAENVHDIEVTINHLQAMHDRMKAYQEALEKRIEAERGKGT